MDDYATRSGSMGVTIVLVLLVAVAAGLGALYFLDQISTNQTQQAQAQAQAEQWKAQQAQAQAQIERYQEMYHTERWQSWLLAMSQVRSDVAGLGPWLFMTLAAWLIVGVFWWLEKHDRYR